MKTLLFTFFILFFTTNIFSQGIIINEVSNGTSGTQEYFELVVIGSSTNPLGTVDLGGWIIDDNNGDFEGTTTTGIATGHIRIKPGYYTSVNPGSIIVIYNNAELSFTPDPLDSNGDCIYFIPIDDESLDNDNIIPSTTNSNYIPAIYGSVQSWVRIGLRNSGDAPQIRKPDGSFYHGFSYGDVLNPYPTFPVEFGSTSSFNIITGSGTGRNYFFNCGSFVDVSNFSRGTAGVDESPGLPNNDANRFFINSIRNGTYDYSFLNNINNCGFSNTLDGCLVVLPISILSFNGNIENNITTINWQIDDYKELKYFELEYSTDGFSFESVDIIHNDSTNYYNTIHHTYNSENYYRLKIVNQNLTIEFTDIIYLKNNTNSDVKIYPNPNRGIINVTKKVDNIKLYNELNIEITNCKFIDNKLIINQELKGLYYVKLYINDNIIVHKIIMR